jgi:hypothetical protein
MSDLDMVVARSGLDVPLASMPQLGNAVPKIWDKLTFLGRDT